MLKSKAFLAAALAAMTASSAASAQLTINGRDPLSMLLNPHQQQKKQDVIAHIRIGEVVETPQQMMPMFGGTPPASLKDIVARLRMARTDGSVKAVIVDIEDARLGFAQIQEIRAEIRKLVVAEKEVCIISHSLDTRGYALASGASNITIVPGGSLNLLGLHVRAPYVKGLLSKIGIEADFVGMGDYKTAPETFTRTGPSDNSRQMTGWLLDGIYKSLNGMIAEGRRMTPDQVGRLIDGGPYTAEGALKAGLIDAVSHHDAWMKGIAGRHGTSLIAKNYGFVNPFGEMPTNLFEMFDFVRKMMRGQGQAAAGPAVAVVYVEGAIRDGHSRPSLLGGPAGAYSDPIRKALTVAANDPSIRAVVLRIDSPGGSATASEVIHNAVEVVRKAGKPVIASMGNVAASGGYYVASPADAIFVSPTTITGSIGVFGGKFVTAGGWGMLGINWSSSHRGDHAGMFSSAAPFTDGERARIKANMGEIYAVFKKRVSDGRGDRLGKPVDELAGGRVFTGLQAIEGGLVDNVGGLSDAIRAAAQRAGLADFDVRVLPPSATLFDMLSGRAGDGPGVSISDAPTVRAALEAAGRIDPAGTGAVVRALLSAEIADEEGVVLLAPEFVIR